MDEAKAWEHAMNTVGTLQQEHSDLEAIDDKKTVLRS